MTIPDITRLTGVVAASISDIERGRIANPSIFAMHKISKALRVDINYFLDEEKDNRGSIESLLLRDEYARFIRDENFARYFAIAQKAFEAGINPDVLEKMVEVLCQKEN